MSKKVENSKKLKIFWTRVVLWVVFACIVPVVFIAWRYDLFKKVGSVQLSGWGLIAIIIVCIFLYVLSKYIRAGFSEWSMTKQIVSGICKIVLPLGLLLAICVSIKDSIDVFIQAVSCVLVSEAIAIPINPFPKWVAEKTQGKYESVIDLMANKIYNNKDEMEK